MKDLIKLIGRRAEIRVNGWLILGRITDVKTAYGTAKVELTQEINEAEEISQWVNLESITLS
jgi:hypothetical protein